MADIKKTIEIIFAGTDKASGVISGISSNVDSFAGSIDNVAGPLAGLAEKVLKAQGIIVGLGTAFATIAFEKSKDFESAVTDLNKVMGENETVNDELLQSVRALSQGYGVTTTEIINSLAGLRQSGYDTADSLDVLDTSLKLARASELNTEEATLFLKRALIGYNAEAESAIQIGNVWNTTSNRTNTTVGQLAEGFSIVARQAKDAGFTFEEASAVLAPIIGVFDSGSEAGIAFSTTLSRLLDPTKDAEGAIRALTGVSGPLNEEFKTGKDLFVAVAKGLQQVDEHTAATYTSQLVGVLQAKRIKVAFDDYATTLEKIGPRARDYNSLQKEVDLQNATTQASIDKLNASFNDLLITMGTQYRPEAQKVIDGARDISNAFIKVVEDGSLDPLFNKLNEQLGNISELFVKVAENLPEAFAKIDFSGLINAISGLEDETAAAFEALFGEIDLTTPEGLRDAIQKVVDGIESLTRVTAGIVSGWKPFLEGIKEIGSRFANADDKTKDFVGKVLGFSQGVSAIASNIGKFTGALDLLGKSMAIIASVQVVGLLSALAPLAVAIAPFAAPAGAVALAAVAFTTLGLKIKGLIEGFSNSKRPIDETKTALEELTEDPNVLVFDIDLENIERVDQTIKALPGEKKLDIVIEAAGKEAEEVKKILEGRSDWFNDEEVQKVLEVIGTENLEKVKKDIDKIKDAKVKVKLDKKSAEELAKELNQLKTFEIQTKLNIAQIDRDIEAIKASAEIAQTAMEWTAKLDIAQVEAATKTTIAAFESINVGIQSTGELIQSSLDTLGGYESFEQKFAARDILDQEMEQREALFALQEKQIKAEIELTKARSKAIKEGDGVIKIDSTGLEPALELVMWEILEKVQIRANEEASEFLLGL